MKKLSQQELDRKVKEIENLEAITIAKIEEAKSKDPFWFYEPMTGNIGFAEKTFLKKWLKDEDIPESLDSQADVFKSNAEIIFVAGGNQVGKSTILAIKSFIMATGEVPDSLKGSYPDEKLPTKFPSYCRVVGVDHKTFLANLLPCFKYWVPREYLKNGKWEDSYSSEQNTIFLYKGGKELRGAVEFMTNQQDVESFQGPARDFIGYDEEPRKDIYKENLMRFTTAKKLDIMFSMTPTGGMGSWVKDSVVNRSEIEEGGSIECFKLASVTNKKANLKILEEVLRGMDTYEELQMRLLGSFVSLSGLVYGKLFNRRVHVIEPFPITRDHIVFRGIDPHLVKPTICVEEAVDRENIEYVIGCYSADKDTQEIKNDLADRARERGYRLGWTQCDKSADSNLKILGDRNVFRELSTGKNAIPALFTSEKFTGSINAGVDEIKKLLRIDERTGKPKIFFFNTPENKTIINAMETMERDIARNEEKTGIRDKIAEGKHDTHAALRYIHQRVVRWLPAQETVPEYEPASDSLGY